MYKHSGALGMMPPERYYEACITYHLVSQARLLDRWLYPFSISQLHEAETGYDFGYFLPSEETFLLQYKRPLLTGDGLYQWLIQKEQLCTLAQWGPIAYYALPAFHLATDWYVGLEYTSFLPVSVLLGWMTRRSGQQALLRQDDPILHLERPVTAFFRSGLHCIQFQEKSAFSSFAPEALRTLADMEHLIGYRVREEAF